MSESWFEHRAHRGYVNGNEDVGLAQASDYARNRLRWLAAEGPADIAFSDNDYWNPWKSMRFLRYFCSLVLTCVRAPLH